MKLLVSVELAVLVGRACRPPLEKSASRKIAIIIQRLKLGVCEVKTLAAEPTKPAIWIRGAIVKLVDLARESIRILKECGDEGIRSDVLAERLNSPKRRVYDVIAVLKALDLVKTKRRFDGTTVTWIDRSRDFVPRDQFESLRMTIDEVTSERNDLQVQVAELKEQIRMTKFRLRQEVPVTEGSAKTEFNTTMLTVRAVSRRGLKRVTDSGVEVVIESYEPGLIVDPTVKQIDETQALLRSLQRL